MNTPLKGGPALARAAADALRRGDARAARDLFLQAAQAGQADVPVLLGLGYACRSLQDWGGMGASADRVLTLEPRNLHALIMKGDSLEQAGDSRASTAFYRAALRSAPPGEMLAPEMLQELRRVQLASEEFGKRYEAHMRAWLRERGYDDTQAQSRVGEALDLLLGRKRVYLQEPRFFYFPQLPPQPFHDRALFPWLDAVEAASDEIRAELEGVTQDDSTWTVFPLWQGGTLHEANAARCPRTLAALAHAPLARIPGRTPTVRFLRLQPRMRTPPQNGAINTRLTVHLPLLVPGQCRLRVGNEMRELQENHAVVFDDTIEHETWNEGDRPRIVLAFDIVRPDLSEDENRWIATLVEGIDAFPGQKAAWDL